MFLRIMQDIERSLKDVIVIGKFGNFNSGLLQSVQPSSHSFICELRKPSSKLILIVVLTFSLYLVYDKSLVNPGGSFAL